MSRSDFQLSYQLSPIILTGGSAASIPGGSLPIISLTQGADFDTGLLSGGSQLDPDDFFAQFSPLPGLELVNWTVGEYPFANAAVAANAMISQALKFSMLMICPVRDPGGYAAKLSTITALKSSLDQHVGAGGTFTVATPSFIFTDCLLMNMRDASSGESKQVQTAWQWDFYKPLVTLEDAEQAQNSLMSKISAGTAFNSDPAWSGLEPTVGNPSSLASPSVVPAASGPAGSGTQAANPRVAGTDRIGP